MRFPTSSVLLALPIMGAAAEGEGAFAQYRAQFQNILGSVGSFLQAPASVVTEAAASASESSTASAPKITAPPTEKLTLADWKDTLYSRVQPDATTPEEWWVLITGGNKTCFGHCGVIESAFVEAAPQMVSATSAPNTAILDCEDQPVLCNSWSASPGWLFVFELLPEPAKTDVYTKRLNLTTTTSETIVSLYESHSKESFKLLDSYFHPLDGVLATNGLAVPVGYVLWGLGAVPSWMMMLVVSFASRTFMGRKFGQPGAPGAGPRTAPAAAAQ